jgi:ABC-type lipoprotein export system ATPase subunit
VIDLIMSIRERHGMTVIVVSYDEGLIARADRVLRIVDGRLEAPGRSARYPSASAGGSRLTRQAG